MLEFLVYGLTSLLLLTVLCRRFFTSTRTHIEGEVRSGRSGSEGAADAALDAAAAAQGAAGIKSLFAARSPGVVELKP